MRRWHAPDAQSKYAAPPLGRPLNLGFLGALLLAIGLSVPTLELLPSLLAMWAPGLLVGGPLMVALLALVTLVDDAGRAHWRRRQRLAGTHQNNAGGRGHRVVRALVTEHTVLLAGFTLPKLVAGAGDDGTADLVEPALFMGRPR